jgi:NADPH-dependent ferric siderophore reductase
VNLAWQTELELPDRRTSDSRLHAATVTAVRTLTPRMIRLTLAGLTLVGLQTRPAQDIELLLADRDLKRIKRRYTIRHCRPEAGELDIDLFLHDYGGPGSNWAHQAHPGSTAEFIGPKGKLELRPADWHLFVGDEASLPAIADLTEALGGDQISIALLEVTDEADQLPLVATDVRWLHRRTEPPGTPQFLTGALRDLHPPQGVGQAYLFGESRTMVALRPLVAELGVTTERVFVKGYWNSRRRSSGAVRPLNPT